jgi:hypothetical protein
MVKITGRQVFTARLRRLAGPEAVEAVGKALFVAGTYIQTDAQHSITEGSTSGKGHVPSLPGEPPNADTHALDRQIETEQVGPLKVLVESRDPKSAWLELGTARMAARPFLMPAAERQRPEVTRLVSDAIRRVNRGTGPA